MVKLDSKISDIKGVGEKISTKLEQIGLVTVGDVFDYFPKRYEDYSNTKQISDQKPGLVTIKVRFENVRGGYRRGGMHITNAVAYDDSGKLAVIWFNQPYRSRSLKTGTEYFLSGELAFKYGNYQIVNPNVERASDMPKHTAKIIPIYSEKNKIKSSTFRNVIFKSEELFDDVDDLIPKEIITENDLMSRADAYREVHLPSSMDKLEKAKNSIAFEELFELQLASLINKEELKTLSSKKLEFSADKTKAFISKFGFDLTDAQRKAAWQIIKDLDSTTPMNRMLQGDVGSGKTVVAAMAAEQTIRNGYQVVIMAPTEVLANQHYKTISTLIDGKKIRLVTSDTGKKEKDEFLAELDRGEPKIFIGTHALIQEKVNFNNLGLAVIDEQHRFGVEQRQKLINSDSMPHLLSMTATPIPRSMALTVYGDLDLSIIDEMPPGRKKVDTEVLPFTSNVDVDKMVADKVAQKEQVYVICPLIESSETISAKNAEEEFLRLKKVHPTRKIGLLHGRLKSEEKIKTLDDFKSGKLDILVSTTVVEVGVDVPKATLIVIEGAERFGLAQLHQLRGRVGRSDLKSHCVLITSPGAQVSRRLKAMEQTNSGFKLAEIDLQIRGPGAIYGTRQHGALDLRMANLTDVKQISEVRQIAKDFLDNNRDLSQYPSLASKINELRSLTQLN